LKYARFFLSNFSSDKALSFDVFIDLFLWCFGWDFFFSPGFLLLPFGVFVG